MPARPRAPPGPGRAELPDHIGAGLMDRADELLAPLAALAPHRDHHRREPRPHAASGPAGGGAGARWRSPAARSCCQPGEATKSWRLLEQLVDELLAHGVERRSTVIALGGGVIGDLAGFAAAILLRGIDFIQIPTTLLAQVDSAVGGKTGINTRHGKNLIGAFHQPRAVLIDTAVLDDLPVARAARRLCRGGQIWPDPRCRRSSPGCEEHGAALLRRRPRSRGGSDRRSLEVKAAIVAADERETAGERALLNFGHTFAHALRGARRLRRRRCCTARRWRSAWSWRSRCRRGWATARPAISSGLRAHLAGRACQRARRCQQPAAFRRRRAARRHGPRQEGRGAAGSGSCSRAASARRSPAPRCRRPPCARSWRRTSEPLGGLRALPWSAVSPVAPGGRPAARRQRLLRRGRVRAGKVRAHPHRGPGRGGSTPPRLDGRHPQASGGLSRRLPARHHHGLARPGLGRRARGRRAAGAAVPARSGLGERLLHTVVFRCSASCCSPRCTSCIGEQVPKTLRDPPAGADLALDRRSAARVLPGLLAAELGAQRRRRAPSCGCSACRGQRQRGILGRRAAPADRRLAPARRGPQARARHAGRRSSTSRARGRRGDDPPPQHRLDQRRRAGRGDRPPGAGRPLHPLSDLARRSGHDHRRAARQGRAGRGPAARAASSPAPICAGWPRRPGSSRTRPRCCTSCWPSASAARTWPSWSTSTAR